MIKCEEYWSFSSKISEIVFGCFVKRGNLCSLWFKLPIKCTNFSARLEGNTLAGADLIPGTR